MLHLLYIIAFTILAFLAIANLVRSMMALGIESQRSWSAAGQGASFANPTSRTGATLHPELLDDTGNLINEPLLVMRSMTVEDAREQLDSLFDASPSQNNDSRDEA